MKKDPLWKKKWKRQKHHELEQEIMRVEQDLTDQLPRRIF